MLLPMTCADEALCLQCFSMKVCISLAALCGVILCVFSEFFAGMYIGHSDPEAPAMSMEAVICLAIALPFLGGLRLSQ